MLNLTFNHNIYKKIFNNLKLNLYIYASALLSRTHHINQITHTNKTASLIPSSSPPTKPLHLSFHGSKLNQECP